MKRYASSVICLGLILIFLQSSADTTIFVEPASQACPNVGETVSISVKVKDVQDLVGCQFELSFDNKALKLISITEGSFLKTGGAETFPYVYVSPNKLFSFTEINDSALSEINSKGAFTIINVRYGTNISGGVNGEGELVLLKFSVIEVKGSKFIIRYAFEDPSKNPILVNSKPEAIATNIVEGEITQPTTVCTKGDVNNDGNIGIDDVILILRLSAKLITPTPQQECSADMNSDGKIDAGDAIRALRKHVGLEPAPRRYEFVRKIDLVLDDIYGSQGETVSLSLKVKGATNISGGDISIAYDKNVLKFDNMRSSIALYVYNADEPGLLRISFVNNSALNEGNLGVIAFKVLSDNISPLKVQSATLLDHEAMPMNVHVIDGKFISRMMLPERTALLQNFPNPFNPETWIPYQLKEGSDVCISIYSVTGELIRELNLGYKPAGIYASKERAAYWDGKDKFGTPVTSGVYFYSIRAKDFSDTKKMIVLR